MTVRNARDVARCLELLAADALTDDGENIMALEVLWSPSSPASQMYRSAPPCAVRLCELQQPPHITAAATVGKKEGMACTKMDPIEQKYNNGSEYYSNPKSQMGTWIDESSRNDIVAKFSDIIAPINRVAISMKQIKIADSLLIGDVFHKKCEYSLTYFHVPSMKSVPSYSHLSGTYLLYKSVYGEGYLKTIFSSLSYRSNLLTTNSHEARIGGPPRQIFNNSTAPCGVVELALYPPITKLESTFNSSNEVRFSFFTAPYVSVVDQSADNIEVITFSDEDKSQFFQPRQKAMDSVVKQRNNTLGIHDSSKYVMMNDFLMSEVGGLDVQVREITRRLLYSRRLPLQVIKLLGKTLLARLLAATLTPRPVKLVNGPEILDKYVGEAERNISLIRLQSVEERSRVMLLGLAAAGSTGSASARASSRPGRTCRHFKHLIPTICGEQDGVVSGLMRSATAFLIQRYFDSNASRDRINGGYAENELTAVGVVNNSILTDMTFLCRTSTGSARRRVPRFCCPALVFLLDTIKLHEATMAAAQVRDGSQLRAMQSVRVGDMDDSFNDDREKQHNWRK
ncbi:unnamed protein product [Sphagnum compactum]